MRLWLVLTAARESPLHRYAAIICSRLNIYQTSPASSFLIMFVVAGFQSQPPPALREHLADQITG